LLLPRPGVPPGQCPFLTVKVFLLLRLSTAQDPHRIFFPVFPVSTGCPQIGLVIRIPSWFSTAVCTGHPQATRRYRKDAELPASRQVPNFTGFSSFGLPYIRWNSARFRGYPGTVSALAPTSRCEARSRSASSGR